MALNWVDRYHKDMEYYIHKATNAADLLKISADIKTARAELDEMEAAIYARFNEIQRVIKYPVVEISREQNQYSRDKKVKINVRLQYKLMLDGEHIKTELEYGKSKQFTYQEKKSAYEYAKQLSKTNNHCPICDNLRN